MATNVKRQTFTQISRKDKILARIKLVKSGCWIWQVKGGTRRYGGFYDGGKIVSAHRASYETFIGPIPESLVLDHLCGNGFCVNPDHLEPVTQKENAQRYFSSLTHCKHGHEFTEENTRLDKRGHRTCRQCHVLHQRDYIERKLVCLPT